MTNINFRNGSIRVIADRVTADGRFVAVSIARNGKPKAMGFWGAKYELPTVRIGKAVIRGRQPETIWLAQQLAAAGFDPTAPAAPASTSATPAPATAPAPTPASAPAAPAPVAPAAPTPAPASADYTIYSDGSCLRNPDGPGGYAAVILAADGTMREISGGEPSTTNNRMELRGCIEGLMAVPENVTVDIHTDSQYVCNALTKGWLDGWKRRGWVTSSKTPVKNQDLWQVLDAASQCRKVRFHWVKGHAGNKYNERCDQLARSEAMKQKK